MPDPKDQTDSAARPYVPDRRSWPRRACHGKVTLWTSPKQSQVAELHDESLTGVAVLVADATMLSLGQNVCLVFPDRRLWAIVRHIQPPEDGRQRVGLEWGGQTGRFETDS
jgi:hypothetical protein